MDGKTITEVLSRLIGYTEPYGDPDVDKLRANNNSNLIYVTHQCVDTLIENAKNTDTKIGQDSYNALKCIFDKECRCTKEYQELRKMYDDFYL